MSKAAKVISLENVNNIFYSEDCELKWRIGSPNGKGQPGKIAGCLHGSGYLNVSWKKQMFQVHRVLYQIYNQCELGERELIDHVDGNKLNNSKDNLRIVDSSKNSHNSKVWNTNTSGHKHISHQTGFDRGCYYECWKVHIRCKDRKTIQKRFKYTEGGLKQAIEYRDSIIKDYHGDYMGEY